MSTTKRKRAPSTEHIPLRKKSKSRFYCQFDDCELRCNYNVAEATMPIYCKKHAASNMIDITHAKCQATDCQTLPCFNYATQFKPAYCKKHATPDMIDLKNRKCQELGCMIRATFNYATEKNKPLYCQQHAQTDMVNVSRSTCAEPDCQVTPSFGVDQPLYCKKHATAQMIDLKNSHQQCRMSGCITRAGFNFPQQHPALYCQKHAQVGMINIKKSHCQATNCRVRALYGWPGIKLQYCATHKQEGMIKHSRRRCELLGCLEMATFGTGNIPQRCQQHAMATDIDLVIHRCVSCREPNILNTHKLCQTCSGRSVYVRLGKQKQVKAALDMVPELAHYESYDTLLPDGCGRERPDFVWDCLTHKLILEVDEYQHQDRLLVCEQNRMVNITQAYHMPCVWIRYNPDTFSGQEKNLKDHQRLTYLQQILLKAMKMTPKDAQDTLRIMYLFHDHFDMHQDVQVHVIPCT
jgi:hypothetical protein